VDITITLEQRHIDALCTNYRFPEKSEKQTDEEFATAKVDFAVGKVVEFIDAHARDCDLLVAEKTAREAALAAVAVAKRPVVVKR